LPEITDPNVLVGPRTADDAAIFRVSDELALIQSVDFFTPVVDDSYPFGAIAAANSPSDVHADVGRAVGVRACTDITGFGLLGHLREMLSGVGARIRPSAVPLLPGARKLAAKGSIPGGTPRNKESLDPVVNYHYGIDEIDRLLPRDAQTSGGLLFAVEPSRFENLLSGLAEAGVSAPAIGEFIAEPKGRIEIVVQASP
jgi:selenide,water dikinase